VYAQAPLHDFSPCTSPETLLAMETQPSAVNVEDSPLHVVYLYFS